MGDYDHLGTGILIMGVAAGVAITLVLIGGGWGISWISRHVKIV